MLDGYGNHIDDDAFRVELARSFTVKIVRSIVEIESLYWASPHDREAALSDFRELGVCLISRESKRIDPRAATADSPPAGVDP